MHYSLANFDNYTLLFSKQLKVHAHESKLWWLQLSFRLAGAMAIQPTAYNAIMPHGHQSSCCSTIVPISYNKLGKTVKYSPGARAPLSTRKTKKKLLACSCGFSLPQHQLYSHLRSPADKNLILSLSLSVTWPFK